MEGRWFESRYKTNTQQQTVGVLIVFYRRGKIGSVSKQHTRYDRRCRAAGGSAEEPVECALKIEGRHQPGGDRMNNHRDHRLPN